MGHGGLVMSPPGVPPCTNVSNTTLNSPGHCDNPLSSWASHDAQFLLSFNSSWNIFLPQTNWQVVWLHLTATLEIPRDFTAQDVSLSTSTIFSFRLCRSFFPCMLHYNKTSLSCCFCIFCYGFSRRILCCQLLQKSHSCSLPKGFLTLLSDNWICPWQSVKGLCQATSPITWGLFSSDSNNEGLHLLKMQLEFLWNK